MYKKIATLSIFELFYITNNFAIATCHTELLTDIVDPNYRYYCYIAEQYEEANYYRQAFMRGDSFVKGLYGISNQYESLRKYINLGAFDRARKEYESLQAFSNCYSNELCKIIPLYHDEKDWFISKLYHSAMICFGRRFEYELVETPLQPVPMADFFDPQSSYNQKRARIVDKLFEDAGMTSEMKAAYIAFKQGRDKNRDDSDIQLIIGFVPNNIHLYGLPNHGKIEYLTGGFTGKNGNVDRRRSKITRHIWDRREIYRKCFFSDSMSGRFFFSRLWHIEDDRSLFLDHLKLIEIKLDQYVKKYGKISNKVNPLSNSEQMIAYESLFKKRNKSWEGLHSIRGCVAKVIDGDTIIISNPSYTDKNIIVRLAKIDAPETEQPFGHEAKQYLESLILNTDVMIYYIKKRLI